MDVSALSNLELEPGLGIKFLSEGRDGRVVNRVQGKGKVRGKSIGWGCWNCADVSTGIDHESQTPLLLGHK